MREKSFLTMLQNSFRVAESVSAWKQGRTCRKVRSKQEGKGMIDEEENVADLNAKIRTPAESCASKSVEAC